uniref:ribosomal protein L23 n=1 Tax=Strombomonas costata TaxID=161230 RepID=UPI0023AB41DC|nr:ribosomal protein L23 [Strombomonas costata]WCH63596.1 ribosomal protein L23 [Strombomonas costata]
MFSIIFLLYRGLNKRIYVIKFFFSFLKEHYINFLLFLKSQVLTEKSLNLLRYNKYTFSVDKKKTEIKLIIEQTFGVQVLSVNTYILPGRKRRLGKFEGFENRYKRVFVTLVRFFVLVVGYIDFNFLLIKFFSLLVRN